MLATLIHSPQCVLACTCTILFYFHFVYDPRKVQYFVFSMQLPFFILSYYDVTVDKYSMKCTKKPVAVFTFCYRLPSENRELLSVNNEMIHPQWHQNRQQKISVFFWRNRNRQTIFSVCALQCQSFMCAVKLWSV